MIESVYLEYRVDHRTVFFLFVFPQEKLLQCLGLSQTSSAVIHPVQLAHDPAPGIQRPGVESLGV